MITARIIADSVNSQKVRLTSFILTYPRFIHSELMTHRAFSRNAASSRAIPLAKMIDAITQEPAMPERWPAEQKGMSGGQDIANPQAAITDWGIAREDSIYRVQRLRDLGVHKSLSNRLLEPFAHMTTLVTSTDRGLVNFFGLRAHKDAQPEFQVLAFRALKAYLESKPKGIAQGDWHIPNFEQGAMIRYDLDNVKIRLQIATARCARLSYLTFEGTHDPGQDIGLHNRLAASGHWSSFEHCAQATPVHYSDLSNFDVGYMDVEGGSGWLQYRKQFPGEIKADVDLDQLMANKPDWITL